MSNFSVVAFQQKMRKKLSFNKNKFGGEHNG